MYLYSNARGGTTTPALNALATILVVVTLLGVGVAFLRTLPRPPHGGRRGDSSGCAS